jgi:hypothetical protein
VHITANRNTNLELNWVNGIFSLFGLLVEHILASIDKSETLAMGNEVSNKNGGRNFQPFASRHLRLNNRVRDLPQTYQTCLISVLYNHLRPQKFAIMRRALEKLIQTAMQTQMHPGKMLPRLFHIIASLGCRSTVITAPI